MILDVNIKAHRIVIAILVFYTHIVSTMSIDRTSFTIQRRDRFNTVVIVIIPVVFNLGLIVGFQDYV